MTSLIAYTHLTYTLTVSPKATKIDTVTYVKKERVLGVSRAPKPALRFRGPSTGSGTFRSPVLSLIEAKVPTFAPKNESFRELSLPGNFHSRELSFLGANVPRNIRSQER